MKNRVIAFAFLSFCCVSPSHALFFSGELTTADAVAQDPGFGEFYYDLYYLEVDTAMTIEVFMVPTELFSPWLGYWDGDFSATPDYDTPLPEAYRVPTNAGDQLYMMFDALPGVTYQIMAATYDYNPTDLGTYNFFITDPERTDIGYWAGTSPRVQDPQSVPAPASWMILALGLTILLMTRKSGTGLPQTVMHA